MDAVEISHISKEFRTEKAVVQALTDISFNIREGEIFGILGPNGAGKTTLLNMMNGMLEQNQGTIKIFGTDTRTDRTLLEKMNCVSGESRFHWCLSAYQVLKIYGMLYNVPADKIRQRSEELIKQLDITSFANRRFDSLSTGQRMRIVIAKALINEPRLLLLDEPTLGLDPHIAIKVRNIIGEVNKKKGTTIIITSHYMDEVEMLCDRVAFIHKGKLIDVGEVKEVKSSKFSTYDVVIDLKEIRDAQELIEMGFELKGKKIKTTLRNDQDISHLMSGLVKKGYEIADIKVKRPNLEDYFVRMLEGK
jgi:ABC-2 type transport system ATP-binding protein